MREIFLIIHFIGLSMGLGTSIAYIFLGRVASTLTQEESKSFFFNALYLRRMGQLGLGILIFSGLYLVLPFWSSLKSNPLLILKFVLVSFLTGLLFYQDGLARKALQFSLVNAGQNMKSVGLLILLVVLIIVVVATYIFR